MPNPYHDAEGRFCSRGEMIAAIKTAEKNMNFQTYYDLRRGLELADSTRDLENLNLPETPTEPRYGWQKLEDSRNFINQITTELNTDPSIAAKTWDKNASTVKKELQELVDTNNDEHLPPIIELIDKYDQLNRKIGHPNTITNRVINEANETQLKELATNPRLTPNQTIQIIQRQFQRYPDNPRLIWNTAMKAQNQDHLRWDVINIMIHTPQPENMPNPATIDPWEHTTDELAQLDSTKAGYEHLKQALNRNPTNTELQTRRANANFYLRLNYLKTQLKAQPTGN